MMMTNEAPEDWLAILQPELHADNVQLLAYQQAVPKMQPEKLDIVAVAKAATEIQIRMGIDSPQGIAFRTYPPVSRKLKAK